MARSRIIAAKTADDIDMCVERDLLCTLPLFQMDTSVHAPQLYYDVATAADDTFEAFSRLALGCDGKIASDAPVVRFGVDIT